MKQVIHPDYHRVVFRDRGVRALAAWRTMLVTTTLVTTTHWPTRIVRAWNQPP
ncbi:MAG: hypothetical protein ACRDOU_31190 [Streptosporangiaceae bacterium]